MKALTVAQIRALEEEARRQGVSDAQMMERAGHGMARWIAREFPGARHMLLLAGKGRNAGDGFVLARHLAQAGWQVDVVLAYPEIELEALAKTQFLALSACVDPAKNFHSWSAERWQLRVRADTLVVEALLGIGIRGPLREPLRSIAESVNRVRRCSAWAVAALDCPAGLHEAFEGTPEDLSAAIVADWTLAAGAPAAFSLQEKNAHWVGRLEIIPIFPEASIQAQDSLVELLAAHELRTVLPRRSAASHKGNFGHVWVVGGSPGMTSAAALAADAALRTGAGLTSALVPPVSHPIVACRAPAEVMVEADTPAAREKLLSNATAIAIGPGLEASAENKRLLGQLLAAACVPVVLDAGALTLLAQDPSLLETARVPLILTPHPGEMRRLIGREVSVEEREAVARAFCAQHPQIVLVLKGARTLIAAKDSALYVNGTGNPGLAKGGSGDALTGIIAALLAQKLPPLDAARLGVWLHATAADVALKKTETAESLIARNVIDLIGSALKKLRSFSPLDN